MKNKRNLVNVLIEIKSELKRNRCDECIINKIDFKLNLYKYKSPEELDKLWERVFEDIIIWFIPIDREIDYKILSIWTCKSIDELKKLE